MTYFMKLMLAFVLMCFGFAQANTTEWVQSVSKNPISAEQAAHYVGLVHKHALANDVNPDIIFKIIRIESRFAPAAIGGKNSSGMMQVIPYWHRNRIRGRNIFDPDVNIEVGTDFYAEKLRECRGNDYCALVRYNAGSHKYEYAKLVLGVTFDIKPRLDSKKRRYKHRRRHR